ncbi:MAG: (Fe-S)-binding protein [Bacteroidetes bacterium]|nr:(Fe-S)-binding protein [Bacteroidota bacterium]HET6244512.1 (Fe-S)-binding protein [Bacteroidia bacterium]
MGIGNIIFITLLIVATGLFLFNLSKVIRNIKLGGPANPFDKAALRWKTMARVALGQSKMAARPIPFFLHLFVYLGFIIVNIEVLDIAIDGVFGTHRFISGFTGQFYNFLIVSFEFLAISVIIACAIFLARRNVIRLKRFWAREMTIWPRSDANIILCIEIALMSAFLLMNAGDGILQGRGVEPYTMVGSFPVSSIVAAWLLDWETSSLILLERSAWWFHIVGIFAFLNYLPYSKHFHIFLAFPNVYFSKLDPKTQFSNLESVTNEVKLMFDPSAAPSTELPPSKFGAKDVQDLSWKNLLDAYTCTECGRCTSECPANITGKLLSPRKIVMDTRDRLEEVGKNISKHGKDYDDGKSLLGDYITPEELWACTTCTACIQACPVNIDPLAIIMDIRRFLVMEQSAAPTELNNMFTNIENNGAPWQFSPSDRLNWKDEA